MNYVLLFFLEESIFLVAWLASNMRLAITVPASLLLLCLHICRDSEDVYIGSCKIFPQIRMFCNFLFLYIYFGWFLSLYLHVY